MISIKKYIERRLKLKVNEEKSQAAKSDRVKFLGMTIVNGKIAISKASMNKAMEMVRTLTPRGAHLPIERAIEQINIWFVGWASYFKMTQFPAQLAEIEARVRRRFRARFCKQQKRLRHLVCKLIKQGVNKSHAVRTVYSNKGIWRLSHTHAVEKAFPNRWFTEQIGQKVFSSFELLHWEPLEQWVKLT